MSGFGCQDLANVGVVFLFSTLVAGRKVCHRRTGMVEAWLLSQGTGATFEVRVEQDANCCRSATNFAAAA